MQCYYLHGTDCRNSLGNLMCLLVLMRFYEGLRISEWFPIRVNAFFRAQQKRPNPSHSQLETFEMKMFNWRKPTLAQFPPREANWKEPAEKKQLFQSQPPDWIAVGFSWISCSVVNDLAMNLTILERSNLTFVSQVLSPVTFTSSILYWMLNTPAGPLEISRACCWMLLDGEKSAINAANRSQT